MTIWRWAAALGVAVIAISLRFGAIDGIKACGIDNVIFKFEMVKTPADVLALFPNHCRTAHIAAQYKGLALDNVFFIPVYSGFLILSLLGLKRGGSERVQKIALTGIVLVVLAAFNDWMENAFLMRMLDHFPGSQETIDKLFVWPRSKFVLLAIVAALSGWLHFQQLPVWRKAIGGAAIIGGIIAAGGILFNHEWVYFGNAVGWMSLIVISLVLAFPKPASPQ